MTYDRVETTYNRAGRAVSTKDQNETVHDYIFDALGRLTDDCVTDLDASLDDAVLRISRTYEVRGMFESVTSWDDPDPGEGYEVNQIVYEYDDFGQLTHEYQEHAGAVDDTPYVEYHYADGTDNHVRLEAIEYPNGRLVHYTYGATDGAADALSRLDAICDDSSGSPGDVLAAYTYLGLGTIVIEDYQEPDVRLDLFGGTTGTYAGLDRFGRVVVQTWYDYGASTNRDQFTYGYDLAGNRLYRENTRTSGMDELYSYDAMNQLVNFQRGDLDAEKDGMTGTIANEETFTLDATGNWSEYEQEVAGSTVLDQSRETNEANELGTIAATTGTNWYDPTHDAAGNMTSIPKPSDPINGLTLTYDAWNRLVLVEDGEDVVAEYQYDGTGRRIVRAIDTSSPDDPDGTLDLWEHFFYSGQQAVETRDGDDAGDAPETIQPHYQYVYSPRYIDAAILRDENLDTDGTCDDGRIYYLSDANYNVTTLIDESGMALERYTYTPYGEPTIYTPTWSSTRATSLYDNSILYTGREYDGATDLYYYRARWYDAGLGRFVGPDPLMFDAGDCNLYRYVHNNPQSLTDPAGQEPWLLPWDRNVCFNPWETVKFWCRHSPSEHLQGLYTTDTDYIPGVTEAAYEGAAQGLTCSARCIRDMNKKVLDWLIAISGSGVAQGLVPRPIAELIAGGPAGGVYFKSGVRSVGVRLMNGRIVSSIPGASSFGQTLIDNANAFKRAGSIGKAARTGVIGAALLETYIAQHCGRQCCADLNYVVE